jgi:hypothetical protein
MADAPNGHDNAAPPVDQVAGRAAIDALLDGLLEPTRFELAPGKSVEIRPLMLEHADPLYSGTLQGAALQRYLVAHCVFLDGVAFGEAAARRLPTGAAARLVPAVMRANGMDIPEGIAIDLAGAGADQDPKP